MSLNLNKKVFFELNTKNLENLIEEIYGQTYSFSIDTGTPYGHKVYTIEEIEDGDMNKMTQFIEGKEPEDITLTLLHDLVNRGELTSGNYLIKID